MTTADRRLVELLRERFHDDPEGFDAYLPGVSELLPDATPERPAREPRSGLTGRERDYHRDGLSDVLSKMDEGKIAAEDAALGLQHCANLIRDDYLTDAVDHETVKALVRAAVGKSPGSYRSKTTVPLSGDASAAVMHEVPAIRGVYLNLDRAGRLVSVSIHPSKVRERRELMRFAGASSDPEPDVAAAHDDYLATQDPHGAA